MDDSPVISKGERKETSARLETGVFLVGGDLRQGAQKNDTGVSQRKQGG